MPSAPENSPERSEDDAALIAWLAERDAACPLCKYNLRGLVVARCPECGERLRLGVSLTEPYMKPWALLVAAWCAAAGLGSLWVFVIARAGWHTFQNETLTLRLVIFFFLASMPVSIALLCTRRRFQRLSRKAQWVTSFVGIILVLLAFEMLFDSMH